MSCKMCKERGKDWNGGDPICAFAGEFDDNWNCATVNAIRDICYEGQDPMPSEVDYRYCDDMKYATVKIDELEARNGGRLGMALWVCWYKNRGCTDAIWLLDIHEQPRRPTEGELLIIIESFSAKQRTSAGSEKGRVNG